MIRLIPPISVPVTPFEVVTSVFRGDDGAKGFATSLRNAVGFRSVELFGSGRAALAAFLASLRTSERREVVVPGYTCWSVPAAVVRAGFQVRLVDVDPMTLDVDRGALSAVRSPTVVSIVLAHLFARSCDVEGTARQVREVQPGVQIIEDAAQAWPGRGSSQVDAVVLSFGRGKPLPLGTGGALLHRGTLTAHAPATASGGWGAAASLALTSFLTRPAWYRIPESLPFLGIGETIYDPNLSAGPSFRDWQGRLGMRLLDEFPNFIQRRTEHARRIVACIETQQGWQLPAPARMDGLLRLPVLAPSREARDRALRALRGLGVSASAMYPGSLLDIPALRPHLGNPEVSLPGSRELADRLLTLPVYPTLSDTETNWVGHAFERAIQVARVDVR